MHALLDAGFADGFFGKTYQALFQKKTGLAWVDKAYPEIYGVIDEVHAAGGLAVVAHPGEYDSFALIEELAQKNLLDGIECWHRITARVIRNAALPGRAVWPADDRRHRFSWHVYRHPRPVGSFLTPAGQLKKMKAWKAARRGS